MDRLWQPQDMVWTLGSLCQLNKIPFDPALVTQQFPPPHSEATFNEAAAALGFKVGRCDTARRKLADLTFPFVAFLRESATSNNTNATPAPDGTDTPSATKLALGIKQ